MNLLNLGCGTRYHNDWTNVDFHSTGSNVIAHNLLNGIPFKDGIFDVVYHSNVIEHFSKEDAPVFIQECYRVLKKDGIIRIVFPDLEQIVLHYIRLLGELKNNKKEYDDDYNWIMLELFDQTVRNYSGGEMAKYLKGDVIPNEQFVISRLGIEGKYIINQGKVPLPPGQSIKKMVKKIMKLLFGKGYKMFEIGRFRLGGEIHQWMYDSYSLSRLLDSAGFRQVIVRDAYTSYIENWQMFNLDTEPDGSIYQADSNYIEALK
ncbi:hypothetical protein FACS189491_09440 [Spirochaetia bacterium]|nr:hypothetical protein FACS189491_09440 [Spirochaetia bacterium]